jgi:hypothetical protein
MPNYGGNVQTRWAICKKLLEGGLKKIDKSVQVSASQIVKIDDEWAELVKNRPVVIINNQNVNIQIVQVFYEVLRQMEAIDASVYREAVLKSCNKKGPDENAQAL